MIPLDTSAIASIAVIGAHCDDIMLGAGATLLQIAHHNPAVVVHGLVLTGAGTAREAEERNAFAALFPEGNVHLTVADLPIDCLPDHWALVKRQLAQLRRSCQPDLVLAPHRDDYHPDRRLVAELIPSEFRAHLVLGYEILEWQSDFLNPSIYVEISTQLAHRKSRLLAECYPSQLRRDWFDYEAFLALMRLRGVQYRVRYAEAFARDKAIVSPFAFQSLN